MKLGGVGVIYWPNRRQLSLSLPKGIGGHFFQRPSVGQTRSAHYLYAKPVNSEENSNGTVYPGGNFPVKK